MLLAGWHRFRKKLKKDKNQNNFKKQKIIKKNLFSFLGSEMVNKTTDMIFFQLPKIKPEQN
jgi:hypothetical protein